MSNSRFREVLNSWTEKAAIKEETETISVTVKASDFHKLEALASVYDQPLESITCELLHNAIREIEAAMPYVEGDKVIRVEDGQEIYEDVGPTPKYVEALNRSTQSKAG